MKSYLLIPALLIFLILSHGAVAFADTAGLDVNGDMICDPMIDMGFLNGSAGSIETFDFFFDVDYPVYSWACTWCVQEKSTVTDPSFTFNIPDSWVMGVWLDTEIDGTLPWFPDQSIRDAYPNFRCWHAHAFDGGNMVLVTMPSVIGTFQYEVAQDGCIAFVIDGTAVALFTESHDTILFDGSGGTVCDPFDCSAPSGTEQESWGGVKALFR